MDSPYLTISDPVIHMVVEMNILRAVPWIVFETPFAELVCVFPPEKNGPDTIRTMHANIALIVCEFRN